MRHPDVRMVRNGISIQQFYEVRRHRNQPIKPTIGWVGATNYRNNDLEQLRYWLPDFLEEHDLAFHHAGHNPEAPSFTEITGVPERRVTTTPILPITTYATGLAHFDIGLVPLSNGVFNRAKSNIKGLEYVAAGIPLVASDLPEYRTLHTAGMGTIARTPEEWVAALTALLDRKFRTQETRRQQALLVNESIEARQAEWQAVFAG